MQDGPAVLSCAMTTPASETLTVRLTRETEAKLAELARQTRRPRSVLAGQAIEAYVDRELAVVAAIHRGLADMEAGRIMPHEEVMAEIDEIIAGVASKRCAE